MIHGQRRRNVKRGLIAVVVILICVAVRADGPKDNVAEKVRPIPPLPTKELSAEDRAELTKGYEALGKQIEALRGELAGKPRLLALLPDVQIYYNAVRYPITYHEQIDPKQGRKALADGLERAKLLRAGQTPWVTTNGPRGYVSRIDGSVQPYVLSVPENFKADKEYRIDFNEHGRNENLTEIVFLQTKPTAGLDHFLVNLYGRYCNANKFAGEIDLLECFEALMRQY